ncbi:hypothetical protein ACFQ2K_50895 [Streptomyces sanglieri]|uniref:Uncharacterized protein n=1 Tax=Streptomyces sanglieri TaxID=193460 RepID=A0ABW2WNA2_9ACTN
MVAAEAPERGPGRAVLAQQVQRRRHDRDTAVVGVVAVLAVPPALPVVAGEVGDSSHLGLGGAFADLVEDKQDRRVHAFVVLGSRRGPSGAPQRLLDAVGVLLLPLEEPGVLVEPPADQHSVLGAVVGLDEQQRHPGLRRDQDDIGAGAAESGVPLCPVKSHG